MSGERLGLRDRVLDRLRGDLERELDVDLEYDLPRDLFREFRNRDLDLDREDELDLEPDELRECDAALLRDRFDGGDLDVERDRRLVRCVDGIGDRLFGETDRFASVFFATTGESDRVRFRRGGDRLTERLLLLLRLYERFRRRPRLRLRDENEDEPLE